MYFRELVCGSATNTALPCPLSKRLLIEFGLCHGYNRHWIVDPEDATVAVFRLEEDAEQPRAKLDADAVLASALLPGFELKLEQCLRSEVCNDSNQHQS